LRTEKETFEMNLKIRHVLLVAAAIVGLSGSVKAQTANQRWHLREGAIICPTPSAFNDAEPALDRGDVKWFLSTGCSQGFGKPEAIITDPVRTGFTWRVHLIWSPDFARDGYVRRYNLHTKIKGKEVDYDQAYEAWRAPIPRAKTTTEQRQDFQSTVDQLAKRAREQPDL
jgi:hypothetical protein